jgi:hypothetical protein
MVYFRCNTCGYEVSIQDSLLNLIVKPIMCLQDECNGVLEEIKKEELR